MNKWNLLTGVTVVTLALDQATKWWVRENLPLGSRDVVIEGFFNLVHVRNRGGAFGLFSDLDDSIRTPIFLGLSALAILVVLSMLRTTPSDRWGLVSALGLVLGGALGNLIDRVWLGSVVDFLDFYVRTGEQAYHWPSFNVADIGIVVGVALLLIDVFRYPEARSEAEPTGPPEAADA